MPKRVSNSTTIIIVDNSYDLSSPAADVETEADSAALAVEETAVSDEASEREE